MGLFIDMCIFFGTNPTAAPFFLLRSRTFFLKKWTVGVFFFGHLSAFDYRYFLFGKDYMKQEILINIDFV